MVFLLSCDIGTSTLRCTIYDEAFQIISSVLEKVNIISSRPGYSEIDPTELWEKLIHSIRKTLENSSIPPSNISGLGLSTQRGTFVLWDKRNGEILHNFITWKDLRSENLVKFWNSCSKMKVHATDHSNASGTALYDPFLKQWSSFVLNLLSIPLSIFPDIKENTHVWSQTSPDLFGASIPITTVVSDQGAAMFGERALDKGDVKLTLGTGAFINMNTGDKPHTTVNGVYPVVGWKQADSLTYLAEACSNDNGTIIEWGKQMKFYSSYSDMNQMALSVKSPDGIFFVPCFQGIHGGPLNDSYATGGFIGLKTCTKPEHLVRAIVESLAFRVAQMFRAMEIDSPCGLKSIKVNGGASNSDLLMQLISTLTGYVLLRCSDVEATSRGCAYLTGLGAKTWKNQQQLNDFIEKTDVTYKKFKPQLEDRPGLLFRMKNWEKALKRFMHWKPEGSKIS